MHKPIIFVCVLSVAIAIIGVSSAELSEKGNGCLDKFKAMFPVVEQIKEACGEKYTNIEDTDEFLEKREKCTEEGAEADKVAKVFQQDCDEAWAKSLAEAEVKNLSTKLSSSFQVIS